MHVVSLDIILPLFLRNLELQGANEYSWTKSTYRFSNLEIKMFSFDKTSKLKVLRTCSREGKNTFYLESSWRMNSGDIFLMS